MADNDKIEKNNDVGRSQDPDTNKKGRRHLIHPAWLRITLKTLMWIIIAILLIPILLYIPPIQTAVKNLACNIVEKSTGMKIGIDKFRIKWPLDVSLQGVSVVEATGDTMVYAKEVIADVKMAPLLKLDIDINKLQVLDAGFRMMSPDSSLLMKVKASLIDIDDKSSVDIKTMDINLNKVLIKDGNLSLNMDVWKKENAPADTASVTPLRINMADIELENFGFEMSMLPTIDTLTFSTEKVLLRNGVVDLSKNLVTAQYLGASEGDVTFITPTPEYIASHPAPVDTTSVVTPPMIIKGDTVNVTGFNALYAVAGAKPLPGFDPSYMEFSGVNITLHDFYNEATTIELPISSIQAEERCGLRILGGSVTFAMDSVGMALKDLQVQTLYSHLEATANVPMSLMEMKTDAYFGVFAAGSVGWPDIESFMPDLKSYTSKLPARSPLNFDIEVDGTLAEVDVQKLDVAVPGVFSVKAQGEAGNLLDLNKLKGNLTFEGDVTGPKVIDSLLEMKDFNVPVLQLKGNASVHNQNYAADFTLKTSLGDVRANGQVSLNPEQYNIKVGVRNINVENFLPDMGIGEVNARLTAQGAGFNPTLPKASTDIRLDIGSITYNYAVLTDIIAEINLSGGKYEIITTSANKEADFNLTCNGTLAPDDYTFDLDFILNNIDLQALGITAEENVGRGEILIKGNASPEKWIYNVNLDAQNIEWQSGNQIYDFPGDMSLDFRSAGDFVEAAFQARQANIDFRSFTGLKQLIDDFTVVGDSIGKQIAKKDLNIEELQRVLPPFTFDINASGNGILGDYLGGIGLSVDTIYGHIQNDSIISGRLAAIELASSTMRADTLSLLLQQRGSLLDYRAHMGNQRNNPIGDFANVNLNGYVGQNRLMLGLWQKNQSGETGYRLGLTAAFMEDSVVTIHFTPLKATIGYIPWQFNDDNHIDVNLYNYHINANMMAESKTSSIMIKTEPGKQGNDELHVALDNIHVQDFLNLSVFAPPITATLNVDLNVGYIDKWLYGTGNIDISDFTYDKMKVGNFDLSLRAGLNDGGTTGARIGLKIDGQESLTAKMLLEPDTLGAPQVKTMSMDLTRFPLKIANAFLGPDIMKLSGYLNGNFELSGSLKEPMLNGYLACDSVGIYIPMMASSLKFNQDSILVKDNIIDFNQFDIWGANNNPLTIDGTVNAKEFSAIKFDLKADANNFQLINNDSRAKSELYGKLFMNLHATAKGPMEHFSINANASILSATDVTYSIPQLTAQLTQHETTGIVRFVNFNDTAQIEKADTIKPTLAMRIVASLNLEPGLEVQVIYPGTTTTGNAKIELSPNGSLNYFQNYMGDMRLNGQLYLGNGYARYSMPIVGDKRFNFNPDSYILWNGDLLNPTLNISATDDVKASVIENGNSRLVNFMVELDVTDRLSSPKILFNLNTDDDITIRNELMSMSPDQRSMAALNMLLTGQYTGNGVKTASSDLLSGTMYNLLTSQINGWLANNVHGVDLSLGVDQYDRTVNGESGTTTSYSYTVSKSLFNNRFKISVGGNYTTDASADENFSENLISDISFEYILKQTTNVTIYARLFRHTGYESILEGEITETGVGFLLRRRLANLKDLFKWGNSNSNPIMPGTGMPGGMHNRMMPTHSGDTIPHGDTKITEQKDSTATKPENNDEKKSE